MLICSIDERADRIAAKLNVPVIETLVMDLTACHLNGTPLDLERLLEASEFDFVHDVWGIYTHIDRTTGTLQRCFMPRTAARSK